MKSVLYVGGVAMCFLLAARAMTEEPSDQKANQKRTIPLSEIVTTGPQKDLQSIDDVVGPAEAYNSFMMQFRNASDGSSNVFLVDAKKIRDALEASANVLFGSRSADTPAPQNKPKPERGSHWLFVYLGSGPSNPTWWTVESVETGKETVTLNYQESPPRPATADVRRYYYWIPLGKLAPGTYELQLFDIHKGTVTLMRRVEIPQDNGKGGER